jgi:hypothetical protein
MMPSPITWVDGAFVAMHGLHHPFEDRIEDLARFLRIAVGQQLHRALQVREQDRNLLALTLERSLRDEDLLDEVLRGIGLEGAVLGLGGDGDGA